MPQKRVLSKNTEQSYKTHYLYWIFNVSYHGIDAYLIGKGGLEHRIIIKFLKEIFSLTPN